MNRETGGSTVVAGSTLRKHKASKHKNWVLLQNAHPQGGLNDDYVFLGRAVDRICIRFHVLLKYRIVKRELSNFELAACSLVPTHLARSVALESLWQTLIRVLRLSQFYRWMITNLLMIRVLRWSDYLNSTDEWWPLSWWPKLSKLCEGERVNVGEEMGDE